jgi:hypothetical protein
LGAVFVDIVMLADFLRALDTMSRVPRLQLVLQVARNADIRAEHARDPAAAARWRAKADEHRAAAMAFLPSRPR